MEYKYVSDLDPASECFAEEEEDDADYSSVEDLLGEEEVHSDDGAAEDDDNSEARAKEKKGIKMMNVIRTIVIATLLTVATISGEIVYIVVRIHQESNLRKGLARASTLLFEGFEARLRSQVAAAQGLSSVLTAFAVDTNSNWPNLTVTDFFERCAVPVSVSFASAISVSPRIDKKDRAGWEAYAVSVGSIENPTILPVQDRFSPLKEVSDSPVAYYDFNRSLSEGIYRVIDGQGVTEEEDEVFLLPIWQRVSSLTSNSASPLMFNHFSNPYRAKAVNNMIKYRSAVMSDFVFQNTNGTDFAFYGSPRSVLYTPVYADHQSSIISAVLDFEFQWEVYFQEVLPLGNPPVVVLLFSSCSQRIFSYEVFGPNVLFLGEGDHSESNVEDNLYDAQVLEFSASEEYLSYENTHYLPMSDVHSNENDGRCAFKLEVYPTDDLGDSYFNNDPDIYRAVVLFMFLNTVLVFIVYDCMVDRYHSQVSESAKRSRVIVNSLFPKVVRDRLYQNAVGKANASRKRNKEEWRSLKDINILESSKDMSVASVPLMVETQKGKLRSFLNGGGDDQSQDEHVSQVGSVLESARLNEPIADLFQNTTVLFGDIAGFTAWSSEREPSKVFTLLETLYRAMDRAARKYKVFKVETIGDCYVAATGVPDPQIDHVERMAKFARTCMVNVNRLTVALEVTLGPGTAELSMRMGMHSGSVTAGVLRGEKARFQLFGDTMNTASRMESTGEKSKIQISKDSADVLIAKGLKSWVTPRGKSIFVKGKGDMQTFWLKVPISIREGSVSSDGSSALFGMDQSVGSHWDRSVSLDSRRSSRRSFVDKASMERVSQKSLEKKEETTYSTKEDSQNTASTTASCLEAVIGQTEITDALGRLVVWNTEVLLSILKKCVASRSKGSIAPTSEEFYTGDSVVFTSPYLGHEKGTMNFYDEFKKVIPLPAFDVEKTAEMHIGQQVEIQTEVRRELLNYVTAIASGYRKNYFHNFEHASHVTMSATKLLKRIVTADGVAHNQTGMTTEELHTFSYGISSDPLTQFAVVFSALIHDVGHTGVPNTQLGKEQPHLAQRYKNVSLAEQRSLEVALELLSLPEYKTLRNCICPTPEEKTRFRNLLVNCILATDIMDKDLKKRRNLRWDTAFHSDGDDENVNRKATIVIEHIIQASDVSHTMQHWHIYQKWNEKLFQELYYTYLTGRSAKDPCQGWYKGELWFFDNYIIPLAGKLKECGVFGVSSDEYLEYAQANRKEWEERGEEMCKEMKQRFVSANADLFQNNAEARRKLEEEIAI